MPILTFTDLGRRVEVAAGARLLDACEANGVPMDAACGGFAACNTCRVAVESEGGLTPKDPVEDPFCDLPAHRLACQAHVIGDLSLHLDPGT